MLSQPQAQRISSAQLPNNVPTHQYSFPHEKLKRRQTQEGKTPLVLVACGSFNPITYLHLRMFEMASDYIHCHTEFEVVGGYLSPVSDAYKKPELVSGHDRVNMCLKSIESSTWIMVDAYETQKYDDNGEFEYVTTAMALQHFDYEINTKLGGIQAKDGTTKKAEIALLVGADLIMSMSNPESWPPADIKQIFDSHAVFVIERSGTDTDEMLVPLKQYKKNIWVIEQLITNDISSTKIRYLLKKDFSVRYLIPDTVIDYIHDHSLFR